MRCAMSVAVLVACAALVACGDDDGGTAATAGTNVSGSGGAGSGGTSGVGGTGGAGGVSAMGGSGGTGGVSATGGSGGTGGVSATGGSGGTGGVGGDSGTGGTGGTGGALSQCVAPMPRVNPGNACRNAPPPALRLNEIVSTLRYPVAIAHAPEDSARLFIVERTGTIQIVRDGAVLSEPFLTVSDVLSSMNEQGLLGMAFDPNYATTGYFYVYFIRNGSGLNLYEAVLKRYTVSATDPDIADPNSGMTLFTVARDEWNHNGGNLAFGPDGCLFVSLGDGGGGNDQHGPIGNGQDIAQPLGKILRIDADNYPTAAPGNLTTQGAYPHIWDYGLRNPWRFSFDRQSGDLYIGDVGQGTWEEVDVEPAGTGKLNYGWRVMEGLHCRGQAADGGGCDRSGLTLPVTEYRNPTDGKAIIGGYVYRGAAIPDLQGRYFYADYQDDRIWTLTWNGTGICDEYEVTDQLSLNGPTSFGEDAAGELYVVTHGGGSDGRLYRIEAE